MELKNILLGANDVDTNVSTMMKEFEGLSNELIYAKLKQLSAACTTALDSLKQPIIDAHSEELAAANKEGKEFFVDDLCFKITQSKEYDYASYDYYSVVETTPGKFVKQKTYASLLKEKDDLSKQQKAVTAKIKAAIAQIVVTHPKMKVLNTTNTLTYLGLKSECKKKSHEE